MVVGHLERAEFIEGFEDDKDCLKMEITGSSDENTPDGTSTTLDRLTLNGVTSTPTARLEDDETPVFGVQSMAAVLGMIMGTEALRFSPMLLEQ